MLRLQFLQDLENSLARRRQLDRAGTRDIGARLHASNGIGKVGGRRAGANEPGNIMVLDRPDYTLDIRWRQICHFSPLVSVAK